MADAGATRGMTVSIAGIGEVMATLGYLPPALAGAIAERNFDLVSHHKRSVLKHHQLPARSSATRFLASRFFVYGRKTKSTPTRIEDAQGESFMAAASGETFGEDRLRVLEEGGTITSNAPMAMPFAPPTATGWIERVFRRGLKAHAFGITPGGLIIRHEAGRGGMGEVIGKFIRSRRQRPLLGFFRQFASVMPRHLPKYERAAAMALTAAGREALEHRTTIAEAGSAAYASVLKAQIDAGVRLTKARRVARAAARDARRDVSRGT